MNPLRNNYLMSSVRNIVCDRCRCKRGHYSKVWRKGEKYISCFNKFGIRFVL